MKNLIATILTNDSETDRLELHHDHITLTVTYSDKNGEQGTIEECDGLALNDARKTIAELYSNSAWDLVEHFDQSDPAWN